jgi:hypothetical protein
MISNGLKTIYDPGIPVNIVDLALIYASKIVPRSRIRKPDQRRNCVAIQQGVATRNAGDMAGHVKLAMCLDHVSALSEAHLRGEGGRVRKGSRRAFDKAVRRKPLALAADAVYGFLIDFCLELIARSGIQQKRCY